MNALPCPSGRGSGEEKPVKLLPVDLNMQKVYDVYITQWKSLTDDLYKNVKGKSKNQDCR